MNYIGIDLGTSSVKLVLMDTAGHIIANVSKSYPIDYPKAGWSEQNPYDWYDACMEGMKELLDGQDESTVGGISFGGQMHGLVILDKNDEVIRPAILWNDGRTTKQCEYLNEVIGRDKLSEYTANIAFAGFTAPKILWVKENEPDNFAKIDKIMLPKDYIAYRLTGVHCTDVSDASGMLLFDVKNRRWSRQMLDICGVTEAQMPRIFESSECVGTVKKNIADEIGIGSEVIVAAGAGDNAAAAVGTGTVGDGHCNISLGTSGTIFISSKEFGVDSNNALHSFAHADGKYHLMGCILSAASANGWWMDKILGTNDYTGEQSQITDDDLGNNNVYFLPYLMGERSPHNDEFARGTFTGMTMDTERKDMTQAVLEGVAFAIRDCFEVAKSLGIRVESTRMCGGGAKSELWCKIMANVLGIPVELLESEEGPAMGAAMLAMVAAGEYNCVEDASNALVKVRKTIRPDEKIIERYEDKYNKFRCIYPAMKNVFRTINE